MSFPDPVPPYTPTGDHGNAYMNYNKQPQQPQQPSSHHTPASYTQMDGRQQAEAAYSHAEQQQLEREQEAEQPLVNHRTDPHSDRYGFPAHPPQPVDNPAVASDLLLYLLAIFVPPLAVFLKVGCGFGLIVNLLLWGLGWLPGVIHAFYVITTHLAYD